MGRKNFNLRRIWNRLRKSLAQRGVPSTAALLLRKLFYPASRTDCCRGSCQRQRKGSVQRWIFRGSSSVLRQILDRLPLDFEEYTFIDLGSGKGRALLIASEYPFRAVVGVELSPKLHALRSTISPGAEGWHSDAGTCARSKGMRLSLFLLPGHSSSTFGIRLRLRYSRVFWSISKQRSSASCARFISCTIQPDLESMIEGSRFWQKMWREEVPMSEEDYAAHAFPPRVEICSVFRSVLPTGEAMSLAP